MTEPEPAIDPDRSIRIAVVVNPKTRRNAARIVEILRARRPDRIDLDVRITRHAGDAREQARVGGRRADLLLAIGGDGTVSEVAGAAREYDIPLAIVPAGSTNIIARGLGIPTATEAAIDLAWRPQHLRTIDAGICNDHTFLHMAGAGFDSLLFELARPALKRRVGWMAYLPAAVAALRRPMSTYTIRTSERTIEKVRSPLVLVANGSAIISPRLNLDREIRLDDGLLDVFVVTATTPREIAMVMASVARRRLGASPHVETWQTTGVAIESSPDIAVQFDGDVAARTPVEIGLAPGGIRVVVPVP